MAALKDATISKLRNSSSSLDMTMDGDGGDMRCRRGVYFLCVRLCVIIKWLLLSFSCYFVVISFTSTLMSPFGKEASFEINFLHLFIPPSMNIQVIINKWMFTLFVDFHSFAFSSWNILKHFFSPFMLKWMMLCASSAVASRSFS